MFEFKEKKLVTYLLLIVIYFAIIGIVIINTKVIKVGFSGDDYIYYECTKENIIEYNDCSVINENELEIVGADPYVILKIDTMPVGDVWLDIIENFSGIYKIYYTSNNSFSENQVAEKLEEISFVGEEINLIRIDFEQVKQGEKYSLVDNVKIILNGNTEQMTKRCLEMMWPGIAFVIVSSLYMFWLVKKGKNRNFILTWIFSIVSSCVLVRYISRLGDESMIIGILLAICCGMFFWGNSTVFEEKK